MISILSACELRLINANHAIGALNKCPLGITSGNIDANKSLLISVLPQEHLAALEIELQLLLLTRVVASDNTALLWGKIMAALALAIEVVLDAIFGKNWDKIIHIVPGLHLHCCLEVIQFAAHVARLGAAAAVEFGVRHCRVC